MRDVIFRVAVGLCLIVACLGLLALFVKLCPYAPQILAWSVLIPFAAIACYGAGSMFVDWIRED